jgi:hypothetical protein
MFRPMKCYVAARSMRSGYRYPSGPHFSGSRCGRTYRGSLKRVRRIKWQEHTPPSFVAFAAAGIATIVLLISWLVTHPEAGHHHAEHATSELRTSSSAAPAPQLTDK